MGSRHEKVHEDLPWKDFNEMPDDIVKTNLYLLRESGNRAVQT